MEDNNIKKSRPAHDEHLSIEEEQQRKKKVMWWSGIVVGVVVLGWLVTLPITYGNIAREENGETLWGEIKEDWTQIQEGFSEVVSITKNGFGNLFTKEEQEKTEQEIIEELEKEVFPQFEE